MLVCTLKGPFSAASLSIEAKLLRWLAVAVLPTGTFGKVVADPAHKWPEAHMFYLMWAGFEDAVLAAIEFCMSMTE